MSILLDALKKSESQRTLGETPGIHTTVDAATANETSGQQWIPLSMLALSAIAIAWFGWQQFLEPPIPTVSSSDASFPELSSQGVPTLATEESGKPEVAGKGPAQERTPVEAYQADGDSEENVEMAPSAGSREDEAHKQNLNQSFANYEAQDKPDSLEEKRPRPPVISKNSQAVVSPGTPPGPETRTQTTVTTQPTRSRLKPVASEPISFWQVPQALRDGLPEIRITVLVYAEATEDRFVLINGQRLVEKEELAPGVVLDEIRRDGAVFSYRKYRFLVKG
jgi:general secretion pathway protein B